jgi:tetratricopeptide (TPR) repeat protein/predicted Ser/Thr protein kinase
MSESDGSLRWLMQAIARLPPREADEELGTGTLVGRYRLTERIGRGGFGVVYRAVDTELGREVALKLLHTNARLAEAQQALLHEAQAMAKLKHANILTVYDVGSLADGQLFVAMELVEGTSLRRWLEERERSPREILPVFLEAASGLAAAHQAGVVHRDFKPDNVLVGRDGVVRVADFGFASSPLGLPGPADDVSPRGGTPRYMPLEQAAGKAPDARMDQFSFAVALWEALAGSHPFGNDAANERRTNMSGDHLQSTARPVPAWIRQPLSRALKSDPAERYASMLDLITALRRDPVRRRRRMMVAIAAAFGCVALTVSIVRVEHARSLVCKGAARKLAGIWDAPRREAVRASFIATGRPAAARAFATTAVLLDDYAAAFVAEHTRACEATQLRREQSAAVEDLRITCLDGRLKELQALSELLSHADAPLIDHATEAARGLGAIGSCADVAALSTPTAPPRDIETRRRIDEARGELAQAKALIDTDRAPKALPGAEAAVAKARAIGWGPLTADALLELGSGRERAGDYHGAELVLEDAVWTAETARYDSTVSRAAAQLARVTSTHLQRFADGRRWARLELATAQRLGDLPLERDAELSLGRVEKWAKRFPEARPHLERALAMTERLPSADGIRLAMILGDLAQVNETEGRYDEALAQLRRALALQIKENPEHSNIATISYRIGHIHMMRGDNEQAEKELSQSLALYEARLGSNSAYVAYPLTDLAEVQYRLGHLDQSLAYQERANLVFKSAYGANDYRVAGGEAMIARLLLELGQLDKARALYTQVLAKFAASESPNDPEQMDALVGMARVEARGGHWDAAEKLSQRAVALGEKLGPVNGYLADQLTDIARMKLEAQRPPAAILADGKRALDIFTKMNGAGSPTLVKPLRVIGEAEMRQGRAADAADTFTRALKLAASGTISVRERADIERLLERAQQVSRR